MCLTLAVRPGLPHSVCPPSAGSVRSDVSEVVALDADRPGTQESRRVTAVGALGVFGAWLIVMPAAVLTVPLRLRSWDPQDYSQAVSVILALGWLALSVAFLVMAGISDREFQHGSRRPLIVLAIPATLVCALLLAFAPNAVVLGLMWVVLQIPVAAVIVSAQAVTGDMVAPEGRGAASAWLGMVPVAALLLGGVLARFLQSSLTAALVTPALLGALCCLPLFIESRSFTRENSLEPMSGGGGPVPWRLFLLASFLVGSATAIVNTYAVGFTELVAQIPADQVQSLASTAVAGSALAGLIAALIAGYACRSAIRASTIYATGGVVLALGCALMALVPGLVTLIVGAVLVGVGFGAVNGSEFALLLAVRRPGAALAEDLGALGSVTTVPYVLIPALGTLIFLGDPRTGHVGLWVGAAVGAVAATAVVLRIRPSLRIR